jgi:hypothetical protein
MKQKPTNGDLDLSQVLKSLYDVILPPICLDCVHHQSYGGATHFCKAIRSPVTGQFPGIQCADARLPHGGCGPNGDLFKQVETSADGV